MELETQETSRELPATSRNGHRDLRVAGAPRPLEDQHPTATLDLQKKQPPLASLRSWPHPGPDPRPSIPDSRRLASGILLATAGVAAGALAYATQVEATWLEVTRREVMLPRLPPALDGLRVAHLSDFHLSRIVAPGFLRRCMAAAMAERPDLILLTGDFVTRKRRYFPDITALLEPLSAPLGVYAVLGNHDMVVGADAVSAAVEAAGARMLRNRHERVVIGDSGRAPAGALWLAGIDSPHHDQYRIADDSRAGWARLYRRHLDTALTGIPRDEFCLLLAHTPDVVRDAARRGVDLMLSGHTHGGQVRFPLLGATVVPSRYGHRYAAGLFRVEGTTLYVNRGLGTVRFPIRFLCRPELSLLTLRKHEA